MRGLLGRVKVERVTRSATILMLLAVVASCTTERTLQTSLTPPPRLPITVLSHVGPTSPRSLFAAPSLVDLQGLIFAIGTNPNLGDCRLSRAKVMKSACWLDITDPGNALLIGALVELPCAENHFSATFSAADEITITAIHRVPPYPPGFLPSGGPPPQPGFCAKGITPAWTLSLLAIPLSALPEDELTIKLVHPAVDLPISRTTVDLKRPVNTSTNLDHAIGQVQAALNLATNDALSRVSPGQSASIVWFGTDRWSDTSLGCPVSGQHYDAAISPGYIVVVQPTDKPTSTEYHVSGNLLRSCGTTAS